MIENGLVARTFRLEPGVATVALNHIITGEALLRSVRAEAAIELDGVRFNIGGLLGQPVHNFLKQEWLDAMRSDPMAWQCVEVKTGKTEARFPWKPRREWMSSAGAWPPPGVRVTFVYAPSADALELAATGTNTEREVLLDESFAKLSPQWKVHASGASVRSSFQSTGKAGEITALENTAVFAERALPGGVKMVECLIDPGTDRSASWGPGLTLLWPNRVIKFYLRPGKATVGITDNGAETELEGFPPGTRYWLRVHLLSKPLALRCLVRCPGMEDTEDCNPWLNHSAVQSQ